MAETLQNPNPNISAYYQTRAAHHGVITSDWLAQAQAQAQAPVGSELDDVWSKNSLRLSDSGKPFSVIDEFNNWRKQPDLAEAVAAIRALASVIRSSEATTMMELEIELKKLLILSSSQSGLGDTTVDTGYCGREMHKVTDECKRAAELEWASGQRELQIQH